MDVGSSLRITVRKGMRGDECVCVCACSLCARNVGVLYEMSISTSPDAAQCSVACAFQTLKMLKSDDDDCC